MGGNPMRETLNIIPTKSGEHYYLDEEGNYWREYVFVTNATSYDVVKDKNDSKEAMKTIRKDYDPFTNQVVEFNNYRDKIYDEIWGGKHKYEDGSYEGHL